MAKQRQPFNPFYVALLVVGVAFTVTACAYAMMMLRATQPAHNYAAEEELADGGGLMELLDERGMEILGVEVLLLAVTTVGAIGLDQYRHSRSTMAQAMEASRPEGSRLNTSREDSASFNP